MKSWNFAVLMVLCGGAAAAPIEWVGVARTKVDSGCPSSVVEHKRFDDLDAAKANYKAFIARPGMTDHGHEVIRPGEIGIVFAYEGVSAFAPKCNGFTRYVVLKGKSYGEVIAAMMKKYQKDKKSYVTEPAPIKVIDPLK